MVSKTATLFLLAHTFVSLLATLLVQSCINFTATDISPIALIQLTILALLFVNIPTFFSLSLLNYCCRLIPTTSRVSFKRHLVTALFLGPLLAQLGGRWMGWVGPAFGSVSAQAAACWEQVALGDLGVIQKSKFCGETYGMGREEAERMVGRGRGKATFVEDLVRVCIFLDVALEGGVCWVGGEAEGEWEEDRVEGEGRNSERAFTRKILEECHAKFGVEVQIIWKKGEEMPEVKLKIPADPTGLFVDLDIGSLQIPV